MKDNCPIIAIGASAGGLAALEEFFDEIPADLGAAFVIIQHLDPKHDSMIAEILARHTAMPVKQIEHGMLVESDNVYVIPPNFYAALNSNIFELSEAVLQHGVRMPIDKFFRSMAEERSRQAVGIILSGTGSDGSLGLRELKAAGGIVIAQSPDTAQFDGMPRAAIATGQVDIISPVVDMIPKIRDYLSHDYVQSVADPSVETDLIGDEGKLNSIIAVLHAQLGVDFHGYKQGTIGRRIARRMSLRNISQVAEYLTCLREDPGEAKSLYQDLLINVTSFFRDPEAFETLYEKAIIDLVHSKPANEEIRVWVPGSATGEEPYSIAMLLIEEVKRTGKACPIQIFATDLDDTALSVGRAGVYSASQVADISSDRLERFFTRHGKDYQVTNELRETVTFAMQNVVSDPPFSRLDLISCRNLLIYLSGKLQDRIIGYFQFALRKDGYLFLGRSESIAHLEGLFETVDKKSRLYRRLPNAPQQLTSFPVNGVVSRVPSNGITPAPRPKETARLRELMQQQLLRNYAPASVLTNAKHQVLYFMGPTSNYLEQPSGLPTQDLLTLARPELRKKLRAGIKQALETTEPVVLDKISIKSGAARRDTRISIRRMAAPDQADELLIVTFDELEPSAPAVLTSAVDSPTDQSTIDELEGKLRDAQEDLQINLEELESTNEELQASNEEMMSVNEELQSANEELETSKEELQAMNEELTTVNNQLKDKVEQLAELNDDLTNFVSSTGIATVLLDAQHMLGRFTPAAKRLFNLIDTDMGRPISDIRQKFDSDGFLAAVDSVFQTFKPIEKEVTAEDGSTYLMRIAPYRANEQRSGGVVVTFVDISQRLQNERELRESEARFRMLVENAPDPLIMVDGSGQVVLANAEAPQLFGYDRKEFIGMKVEQLIPSDLRKLHVAHRKQYAQNPKVRVMGSGVTLQARMKNGDRIPVEVSLSPVSMEGDEMFCASIRDTREHQHAMEAVKEAQEQAVSALEAKSRFLATASHDLRQPLQSLAMINESLQLKIDDPELAELVERERVSLAHMRSLLNSLLDISKLDAGAMTVKSQDVDLRSAITKICEDFQAEADSKDVKLVVAVQDRIVRSDSDLLQQVFRNLIGNAIRYTNEGSVTVQSHTSGASIIVEVVDTGVGIPTDQVPHIFEEFYQIDRDPQKGDAGLGLGLSIASRIVEQLGSKIEVKSVPGKGSTFSLELPLSDMLLPDQKPEKAKGDVKPPKSGIILLVDDDPAVLNSTKFLLKARFGKGIHTAQSPKEAEKVLAQLSSNEPDIIVTDHHLGASKNGIDLIEYVRQNRDHYIPAILISGDSGLDSADLKNRGIILILKPSRGNELVSTIGHLIAT
ncbi:chemotaxis protein CheB [Pontixanthobacter gangjinensis]|nr:chemotaxis protein CheB [Pontixanthobacter gangjinensis]